MRCFDPMAEEIKSGCKQYGHRYIETIQPAKFRIAAQIRNDVPVGAEPAWREEPPHVAPQEAVLQWRMKVRGGVGMAMVIAVMRRPPQRPALHAGRADQREHELHGARSLERLVREIAVIKPGQRKHAHGI